MRSIEELQQNLILVVKESGEILNLIIYRARLIINDYSLELARRVDLAIETRNDKSDEIRRKWLKEI
jgi:phage anti-repressor protein